MTMTIIRKFLNLESSSGILLFIMMVFALILDNSIFSPHYQSFFNSQLSIDHTQIAPLSFWINEGLMTLFFLVVGLELKREFIEGELNTLSESLLPAFAALGGMLVPAIIYYFFNAHDPVKLQGWAIPVATDIAFSLGVLSLFGKKIPIGLKLFLMALAIFDDLGAIIIIAIFYGHSFSILFLFISVAILSVLLVLNYFNVKSLTPYLFLGLLLWYALYKSGIHPTLSGVLLAFAIPLTVMQGKKVFQPAKRLESSLHPYVAFFILPIFAFANSGISFSGISPELLKDSITLGIFFGLVIGKQIGVFSFSSLLIYFKKARLPKDSNWLQLYAVSILCGIGFTMSLFLGTLAFQDQGTDYLIRLRIGVLLGSLISGVIGATILMLGIMKNRGKRV